MSTQTANAALTWDQLSNQIGCKKTPVAFSWHWPGGGGHMMVAYGYEVRTGDNYVMVHDPWPPNLGGDRVSVSYDSYVADQGHTHWNDYYDIHP